MMDKDWDRLFRAKIQEAREALEESDRISQKTAVLQRKNWEELAGPLLECLLESRTATLGHLSDEDRKLRLVSLLLLSEYWGLDPGDAPACERLALNDPDAEVASIALSCWGESLTNTNDPRSGKLFAVLVKDVTRPLDYRAVAYNCLFQLRGLPLESWPSMPGGIIFNARFPEEVDWKFVDTFLGPETMYR